VLDAFGAAVFQARRRACVRIVGIVVEGAVRPDRDVLDVEVLVGAVGLRVIPLEEVAGVLRQLVVDVLERDALALARRGVVDRLRLGRQAEAQRLDPLLPIFAEHVRVEAHLILAERHLAQGLLVDQQVAGRVFLGIHLDRVVGDAVHDDRVVAGVRIHQPVVAGVAANRRAGAVADGVRGQRVDRADLVAHVDNVFRQLLVLDPHIDVDARHRRSRDLELQAVVEDLVGPELDEPRALQDVARLHAVRERVPVEHRPAGGQDLLRVVPLILRRVGR
jgi:hypothetical protein